MSLKAQILRRIAAQGPMPVSEYMALCLSHPEHGYYTRRDPLGAQGDFTTAPEISQMFGEMLGLALAQAWLDQGRPDPVILAELGPGRGTLMADALRAARAAPGFLEAARVNLVEISPVLRAKQAQALAGHAVEWRESVEDLPEGPLFLLANEFFDALPIRQFIRAEDGWRERMIAAQQDRLVFGLGAPIKGPLAPLGAVRETCAPAAAIMTEIARRIAVHGGAAIIVDYGYASGSGDTFQALRGHAYADPLDAPGEADLTAHVDFGALAAAAIQAGAQALAIVEQGAMLARLGIGARAQALAAKGDAGAVADALERLTAPDRMGTLFKALAVVPTGVAPPPGFALEAR